MDYKHNYKVGDTVRILPHEQWERSGEDGGITDEMQQLARSVTTIIKIRDEYNLILAVDNSEYTWHHTWIEPIIEFYL